MSTDLVVPHTGEILPLEDPAACAKIWREIRDLEDKLKDARSALAYAIIEDSARLGKKTIRYGPFEAKVSKDSESAWDYEILLELVDAGLPEDRWNALVQENVEYKVNGQVAREIASANEIYKEIITRAKTTHYGPERVSVSRKGTE